MAKKQTTVFFCNECGYESSKWLGKCPACGKWNTFVEEKVVRQQRFYKSENKAERRSGQTK